MQPDGVWLVGIIYFFITLGLAMKIKSDGGKWPTLAYFLLLFVGLPFGLIWLAYHRSIESKGNL